MSASVLGMGVAVMITTSMSPSPLPLSAIRWWRPNRCCSSTTARERSAKDTASCTSAWVPITRSTPPSAIPARIRARSFPVTAAVSSAYVTGSSLRRRRVELLEQRALAVRRRRAARAAIEEIDRADAREQGRDRAGVLGGEDLGGRHDGGLMARLDRDEAGDTATSVFPEPTSPCRRTFIGRAAAIAAPTSSIARVWAFVGSKGRVARSRSVSSPSG